MINMVDMTDTFFFAFLWDKFMECKSKIQHTLKNQQNAKGSRHSKSLSSRKAIRTVVKLSE